MKPLNRTKKLPFLPVVAGLVEILVPMLIAAGCTGNHRHPNHAEETQWVLIGYFANDTFLQPLDGTTVTLQFGKDGSITRLSRLQPLFCPVQMKGTAVTIGQAGSTLMCLPGRA